MTAPGFEQTPDGGVFLSDLAPAFVHVLREIPAILAAEDEAVRGRIFPYPSDDPDDRKEWERLVHPDLFALVRSAHDIVSRDLQNLKPRVDPPFFPTWDLAIPAAHVQAWLSAFNIARLALGAMHDIEEEDMGSFPTAEEIDERQMAVLKINLLGWLQQVLLEGLHPPPEDDGGDGQES